MTTHMSIRLAWHNDGWNGHICKRPCKNTYCVGQHSYPGDAIARSIDLDYEEQHAGEVCSLHPGKIACGLSVNAFGKATVVAKVDPPAYWDKQCAESVNITLLPSTVCTWCYEPMYDDEVMGGAKAYDGDKRRALADKFFKQFTDQSLIFYYAGYSNPFSENEEKNYVIVGISRVKSIGSENIYNNVSEEYQSKYSGGLVWQRAVTSTFPDEGFCIPFHKYMDNDEIRERLVIKPQHRTPFKYACREVGNDDAIEIIFQLLAVVDTLIEVGDDSEDWNLRKEWLNSVLNELWTARGPFPGLPSVLECLGLKSLISEYVHMTDDDAMKSFKEDVRNYLEEKTDSLAGISLSPDTIKRIRRGYQLLGDAVPKFMFDVLARFAISAEQVKAIISDDREKVSILASVEDMTENPYIIFEQYYGKDPDDTIPLYKIDNGVIPSPEFGLAPLLDAGSTERFRAYCVDELNKIAAHSFGKAESILQVINARLERMPEWKRYSYRLQNFNVEKDILDSAIRQKIDETGALFLYLTATYDDERTVETTLKRLAERPDIQLKMAISQAKFKQGLRMEDSKLEQRAPEEYEAILTNQAEICMQIFNKPLCVLSGAAGTGKTTVIRTILDSIERVHGGGASFLLLAPTGKAVERIKAQTKRKSSTIHSHLAQMGWLNDNLTLRREGGQRLSDVNTVIIDECSMIDLQVFATLLKSINWNCVQRLILVGDPNQLPPIGRGKVFADTIEWLLEEYRDNVGILTKNIRQLSNSVNDNDNGILHLADVFIQEKQQANDVIAVDEVSKLKVAKEQLFANIAENGNSDVFKDLGVYFWHDQQELEMVLTGVMRSDLQTYTNSDGATGIDKLWSQLVKGENGHNNPDIMQIISPYRGEFYGTNHLNVLLQRTLNAKWSTKKLDGIGYFDKVIQIRNRPQSDPAYAYQYSAKKNVKADVYNGEIGLSFPHGKDTWKNRFAWLSYINRLQVNFSGDSRQGLRYNYGKELGECNAYQIPEQKVADNLELAYAISVHKSQGSEFDYVYIVIPNKDSHLMSMELLYTAITRAQKKVTLFIQDDISALTSLCRTEKSAVRKINSSIFSFKPLPDTILYADSKWYESGKQVSTLSKYFVRSKSEAIIANLLVDRGVQFKYEEPLYAPDGTMFLPDFTVTLRGEEYYWEHVGLLNDDYMEHWAKKEAWYNKHFPGRLLVTYEGNELSREAEKLLLQHM